MALKNSARWVRKEREIDIVRNSAGRNDVIRTDNGSILSTEDIVEEIHRDSPIAQKAVEDLLS